MKIAERGVVQLLCQQAKQNEKKRGGGQKGREAEQATENKCGGQAPNLDDAWRLKERSGWFNQGLRLLFFFEAFAS